MQRPGLARKLDSSPGPEFHWVISTLSLATTPWPRPQTAPLYLTRILWRNTVDFMFVSCSISLRRKSGSPVSQRLTSRRGNTPTSLFPHTTPLSSCPSQERSLTGHHDKLLQEARFSSYLQISRLPLCVHCIVQSWWLQGRHLCLQSDIRGGGVINGWN